jgi:hypothetical protein
VIQLCRSCVLRLWGSCLAEQRYVLAENTATAKQAVGV